ncbi:HNH endonuclease signature motif containing protein [Actinocorallia libanotica]|uniref:HNH nuclease domain-containing protein n=1 Tax=Actinocorallia libanotica TaxID=46162 RepID=A0ABP4BEL9_9ACTN
MDLTAAAVHSALLEFDDLGREAFLAKYGFHRARKFFVRHEGREYDSKAIAGAAHGYLPGTAPLRASEFSGGESHVVGVLRALGFTVIDRSADPIPLGPFAPIRGLKPNCVKSGPMLKQAVVLAWAIGRAVEGHPRLEPWAQTRDLLHPLLKEHKRDGESDRPNPAHPVAALYQAGLWDLQGFDGVVPTAHGHPEDWFASHQPLGGLPTACHTLVRASATARFEVLDALQEKFELPLEEYEALLSAAGIDNAPSPVADSDSYARLCRLAEARERRGLRRTQLRNEPVRLDPARQAVLERSAGHCEFCGAPAPDVTDRGTPVLEIDHIEGLAAGGRDHPEQMIALCPNCHAVKTRGTSRHTMTEQLRITAAHSTNTT